MLSEPEIIALLRENETFATAPDHRLDELAAGFSERSCEAGETLIEQGTKGGILYLIIEGEFGVFVRGREQVAPSADPAGPKVATLGRSHIVGEIGAVSGIPATATVRALTDGRVLELDEKLFQELMYHSPKLAESVLRSLTRYIGSP
jgi:CRP-like cAMP-binding protein